MTSLTILMTLSTASIVAEPCRIQTSYKKGHYILSIMWFFLGSELPKRCMDGSATLGTLIPAWLDFVQRSPIGSSVRSEKMISLFRRINVVLWPQQLLLLTISTLFDFFLTRFLLRMRFKHLLSPRTRIYERSYGFCQSSPGYKKCHSRVKTPELGWMNPPG